MRDTERNDPAGERTEDSTEHLPADRSSVWLRGPASEVHSRAFQVKRHPGGGRASGRGPRATPRTILPLPANIAASAASTVTRPRPVFENSFRSGDGTQQAPANKKTRHRQRRSDQDQPEPKRRGEELPVGALVAQRKSNTT